MVVVVLAGLAVLGAVVALAMGRGGELAAVRPDHPPSPLPDDRPVMGMEVAYLRLPHSLIGYQTDVADEVVRRLAAELSQRDLRIADLEHRVNELHHHLRELEAGEQESRDLDVPEPETGETGPVGGVL